MTRRLRDRGEIALLEEIRRLVPARADVLVGPGDDAAVVRGSARLLLTTDALVEGVHFRRAWLSARELGRRAFHVAASDVAAMGGRARAALLAVAAPADLAVADLRGIVVGVRDAAARAGAALAGGNLASARELALTVSVVGDAPTQPILRRGARPGDRIYVTGSLGGAAFGLRLLAGARRLRGGEPATRWWRRPTARLEAGRVLATAGIATAMIDLSDGLLVDADRLCRASACGAVLRVDRLPIASALRALPRHAAERCALGGGEDYELLFTVPARSTARLVRLDLGCRVSCIGEIAAGRGVRVVDAAGDRVVSSKRSRGSRARGYEHFRR
jgi:thiamine-monophosphate kinase